MPPNAKGGKQHKKQKSGESKRVIPYIEVDLKDNQMPGRVLRMLGNRNVLVYCNDNRLRICHIRGKIRHRDTIEPGDMVLISIREFSAADREAGKAQKGDILDAYAPEHMSTLRSEPFINPKLFMKLEVMDGMTLNEIGVDKSKDTRITDGEEDFGFTFDRTEEEIAVEQQEAAARNEIVNNGGTVSKQRGRGGRAEEATRATMDDEGDVDIDAI